MRPFRPYHHPLSCQPDHKTQNNQKTHGRTKCKQESNSKETSSSTNNFTASFHLIHMLCLPRRRGRICRAHTGPKCLHREETHIKASKQNPCKSGSWTLSEIDNNKAERNINTTNYGHKQQKKEREGKPALAKASMVAANAYNVTGSTCNNNTNMRD